MAKEKTKKQHIKTKPKFMKTTNYPVADFLIRLKNLTNSGKKELAVGKTNLVEDVAKSLQRLGYISEVVVDGNKLMIKIAYKRKEPVLSNIKIISKPGMRIYMGKDKLKNHKSPTFFLLSTSKGILSSSEAIKKGVGGEVLAEIL
jgi:small subunit ribosomal protein S8